MITEINTYNDFWTDFKVATTNLYRSLNPFVGQQGEIEFFGFKSIQDIPIINNVMDWTGKTFNINWNLNESPFWREYGTLIATTLATTLVGSILPMVAPALATTLFSAGSTTITISNILGASAGIIAKALTEKNINQYITQQKEKDINTQKENYIKLIKELKKIKQEAIKQKIADINNIDNAINKLNGELTKINIKEFLPIIAGIGSIIILSQG